MSTERASVEVFERGEKSYYLTVEPRSQVGVVFDYLKQHSEEITVKPSEVVGDLVVELLNGKSLEQILGQVSILKEAI